MKDPFSHLVLGVALTLMIGWILVIGRAIILPVFASVVVAYIVLGLAELVGRVPGLGPRLPPALRYAVAVVTIGAVLVSILWLVITNLGQVAALLARYQDQILVMIQSLAERLNVEGEASWETLRRELLGRIDLRRAIGASLASVATIVATLAGVFVYAAFILLEQKAFADKIALLSEEPAKVAQIQQVIRDINSRIGTYLVMKTLINITLGTVSYGIMRWYGIEFAAFWAILIGLLNYIPYVGSFVGVFFPATLAVLQFGAFWPVASFVLAMAAIQILLGNFVEPWLMGNSLNLSRFVILVSLVAWASIWGIPGVILSIPIMAILVIIFSEFSGTRPIAIMLSRDGTLDQAPPRPPRGGGGVTSARD